MVCSQEMYLTDLFKQFMLSDGWNTSHSCVVDSSFNSMVGGNFMTRDTFFLCNYLFASPFYAEQKCCKLCAHYETCMVVSWNLMLLVWNCQEVHYSWGTGSSGIHLNCAQDCLNHVEDVFMLGTKSVVVAELLTVTFVPCLGHGQDVLGSACLWWNPDSHIKCNLYTIVGITGAWTRKNKQVFIIF